MNKNQTRKTPRYWVNQLDAISSIQPPRKRIGAIQALYKEMKSYDPLKKSGALFSTTLYPPLPDEQYFLNLSEVSLIGKNRMLKRDVCDELEKSNLAALLYAFVWKNGGRNQFMPLMQGILDRGIDEVENDSYVFYQFGKHLVNRNEPIVDQHTGRAYAYLHYILKKTPKIRSGESYQRICNRNKLLKGDYLAYLSWIDDELLPEDDLSNRKTALSDLDKIMFTLGKLIKT